MSLTSPQHWHARRQAVQSWGCRWWEMQKAFRAAREALSQAHSSPSASRIPYLRNLFSLTPTSTKRVLGSPLLDWFPKQKKFLKYMVPDFPRLAWPCKSCAIPNSTDIRTTYSSTTSIALQALNRFLKKPIGTIQREGEEKSEEKWKQHWIALSDTDVSSISFTSCEAPATH